MTLATSAVDHPLRQASDGFGLSASATWLRLLTLAAGR